MITHGAALAEEQALQSRLAVRRLSLTNFRNYADLRVDLDGLPVVLTGPNGAGKTNLLEAVSFLSPGRGLRGARLEEVAPHLQQDTRRDARVEPCLNERQREASECERFWQPSDTRWNGEKMRMEGRASSAVESLENDGPIRPRSS